MKKYILDTNIASLLGSEENEENRLIFDKFYSLEDDDVVVMVSVITLYEAYYGSPLPSVTH
jgi:predicted nucleic acid-binding protein